MQLSAAVIVLASRVFAVDEGKRSTYQPLRFRRDLLPEENASEKKKMAGIYASNLVSTGSSNGARDAAISAIIRNEPTNSARLIDGPIASEHPEQQQQEGHLTDDGIDLEAEAAGDTDLGEDASQTTGTSTDRANSAKLVEGSVDGASFLAATSPTVANNQPLTQSQIDAEREDIDNAKRASLRTAEQEAAARKAAAAAAATLSPVTTNPGTTYFSSTITAGTTETFLVKMIKGPVGSGLPSAHFKDLQEKEQQQLQQQQGGRATGTAVHLPPTADVGSPEEEAGAAMTATTAAERRGDSILEVDGAIADPIDLRATNSEEGPEETTSIGSTEVFESTKSSDVAVRPSSVDDAHLRARQSRQVGGDDDIASSPDVEAEAKAKVEADGARWTASARWLAARVQQQQEEQVQELASSAAVDVGVLEAASVPADTGRRLEATSCPAPGYVDCVDGFVNGSDDATTCYEACSDGAYCCKGTKACTKATACIKKDNTNPNCYGREACYKVGHGANKPIISGGSCSGSFACQYLAYGSGTVGAISNSCKGTRACKKLAFDGGEVGDISNSCTGYNACYKLGYDYGTVGAISNSCTDTRACYRLATTSGNVGDISNSCFDENACYEIAKSNGNVGNITNSCYISGCCTSHCRSDSSTIIGIGCDSTANIENTCPTSAPSSVPSSDTSSAPSSFPSSAPSSDPSSQPSESPSSALSSAPSSQSSTSPSSDPSSQPSESPSSALSSAPSSQSSTSPSSDPSSQPSESPSSALSSAPSSQPSTSSAPSGALSSAPSPLQGKKAKGAAKSAKSPKAGKIGKIGKIGKMANAF